MNKEKWHEEVTCVWNSLRKTEQRRWKNKVAFVTYVVNSRFRGWSFLEKETSEQHAAKVAASVEMLGDWQFPKNE